MWPIDQDTMQRCSHKQSSYRICLTHLAVSLLVLWHSAYAGFQTTSESYSGDFHVHVSGDEIAYLQNGMSSMGNKIYLVPMFSYQVCYDQDSANGSAKVNIVTDPWPSMVNGSGSDSVPIALRVTGNGESSAGVTDILFLPSTTDRDKTIDIHDNVAYNAGTNGQIVTASFSTATYGGTKKAFNEINTLLDHYTNGGVSNPASPSSPAAPSTSQFVFDRTTFNAGSCLATNDNTQSGAITITGYAYMKELTENPAQEYTLSSSLQFKIEDN